MKVSRIKAGLKTLGLPQEGRKDVLKETLNVSSSRTITKWIDKLIKLGYVAKVERGHYVKLENELDQFLK